MYRLLPEQQGQYINYDNYDINILVIMFIFIVKCVLLFY